MYIANDLGLLTMQKCTILQAACMSTNLFIVQVIATGYKHVADSTGLAVKNWCKCFEKYAHHLKSSSAYQHSMQVIHHRKWVWISSLSFSISPMSLYRNVHFPQIRLTICHAVEIDGKWLKSVYDRSPVHVGSIGKVVRLVTRPKEIAVSGPGGALQAPSAGSGAERQKLTHFLESERHFWQQNCYVAMHEIFPCMMYMNQSSEQHSLSVYSTEYIYSL